MEFYHNLQVKYMNGAFMCCNNLNQNIFIPNSVIDLSYAFNGNNMHLSHITIDVYNLRYFNGMIGRSDYVDRSNRINVYIRSGSPTNTRFWNGGQQNNLGRFKWTLDRPNSCYYNTYYNIYIYYTL